MITHNKQSCPTCGQSVNRRRINCTKAMVSALIKVREWCIANGRTEFSRAEIKHLFTTETETATFGDWVHFGGMLYKPAGRGSWGIHMDRATEFLAGRAAIKISVWHDPLAKTYTPDRIGTIRDVKGISAYTNAAGDFIVEYEK